MEKGKRQKAFRSNDRRKGGQRIIDHAICFGCRLTGFTGIAWRHSQAMRTDRLCPGAAGSCLFSQDVAIPVFAGAARYNKKWGKSALGLFG